MTMKILSVLPALLLRLSIRISLYVSVYIVQMGYSTDVTVATTDLPNEAGKVLSFTEQFIAKRAGREINMNKLMMDYALICPINDACDVDFNEAFVFSGDISHTISGCKQCTCERSCIDDGNCCPGTHYGYVDHQCMNTKLYPKEVTFLGLTYMVGTCLSTYTDNSTVIDMCATDFSPCTATESGLVYKNQYCGICNEEIDCNAWKLNLHCSKYQQFQEHISLFTSTAELKEALDQYHCIVQFQPTKKSPSGSFCSINDYREAKLVGKCNVTGLWSLYDADMQWACEHFVIPFKEFKNVYCYICNPSLAAQQHLTLIDGCTNMSFPETNEACKVFPSSERLLPFKNIYCYACNNGPEMLFDDINPSLKEIVESNPFPNFGTYLSISLAFSGDSNVQDVISFVGNSIQDVFGGSEGTLAHSKSKESYLDTSHLHEIIESYIAICGTETLCIKDVARLASDERYGNPVCGTCTCRPQCAENEDCCADLIFTKTPYSCVDEDKFPSFYGNMGENSKRNNVLLSPLKGNETFKVIDICLDNEVDDNLSNNCSKYYSDDYLTDIPITVDANIAYRNIYCYSCNNNKSDIILKLQVYCDKYMEHELFTNMYQLLNIIKLYCYAISFVPIKSKTCTDKYDEIRAGYLTGEMFVHRHLHPSQFESKGVKHVELNATSVSTVVRKVYAECNTTGYWRAINKLTNKVCADINVNVMSLPEYRMENNVYKNFACFLCNPDVHMADMDSYELTSTCLMNSSVEWYEPNETLEELCNVTQIHHRWYPYANMYCSECNRPPWQLVDVIVHAKQSLPTAGYKYIFSLSMTDFQHLDTITETEVVPDCPDGAYDHSLKQCRTLYCNDGFQLFNNTCKLILESASFQVYDISFLLRYQYEESRGSYGKDNMNSSIVIGLKGLCGQIVDTLTESFGSTTDYLVERKECMSSYCLPRNQLPHDSQNYVQLDATYFDFIQVHYSVKILYSESISAVQSTLVNSLKYMYYIQNITDINGNSRSVTLYSNNEKVPVLSKVNIHSCFVSDFASDSKIPNANFIYARYVIDRFFLCAQVKLNLSEVCLSIETGDITLTDTNVTFDVNEYKQVGAFIIVCSEDFIRKTFKVPDMITITYTAPIKSALIIFTMGCTLLSLTCLVGTVLTYFVFSELRTLPGKNLIVLCLYLICSQAFLQFGINIKKRTAFCSIVGICIHLFSVGSFCAMNVCSFHTFKIFYFNELTYRTTGSQTLFLKYLAYIITFPISLVLITMSINLIMSDASIVGYGKYYCFISDFYIFLGTFVIPASLIFLSNIVFFSIAFHKIRSTSNVQSSRERNNFAVCLKLCTIIGITWPLLIVDNTLEISWFSFLVSGLNSLQGVFIFSSFVLNKRVAMLFKARILKSTKNSVIENTGPQHINCNQYETAITSYESNH